MGKLGKFDPGCVTRKPDIGYQQLQVSAAICDHQFGCLGALALNHVHVFVFQQIGQNFPLELVVFNH
jgi:hypothetical protein